MTSDDRQGRIDMSGLEQAMNFSPADFDMSSSAPGGAFVHKAIGKLVSRQTYGILEQVQEFAKKVLEAVAGLDERVAATELQISTRIDELTLKLGQLEKAIDSGLNTFDANRLDALEAAEAKRAFNPTFSNETFEAAFRGSYSDLAARYEDLADEMVGLDPVLDLGFGRGEFLQLLAARGVKARGIEIDPELVEAGRAQGLDVEQGEAISYLAGLPDSSLGGAVLIQVVEHLTQQQLLDLVSILSKKVRKGGKVLVETVNPQSLYVFARSFYIDPTHTKPVHPAYLLFLFKQAGFAVRINWRSLPSAEESLSELPGEGALIEALNENIRRTNAILFGPQDYALIGVRDEPQPASLTD